MALDLRQQFLNKYRIGIWRKYLPDDSGVTKPGAKVAAKWHKIKTGVPAYFESTPETDEPTPVGRMKEVNIFTLDKWHMEAAIDVRDTDMIEMESAPLATHPDIQKFWAVQGNTRVIALLANKQSLLSKRTDPPPGAV